MRTARTAHSYRSELAKVQRELDMTRQVLSVAKEALEMFVLRSGLNEPKWYGSWGFAKTQVAALETIEVLENSR